MSSAVDKIELGPAGDGDRTMAELYARAFREFGVRALWNLRQLDEPTAADVLATARQLRIEGNLAARALAEEMEKAARAHQ